MVVWDTTQYKKELENFKFIFYKGVLSLCLRFIKRSVAANFKKDLGRQKFNFIFGDHFKIYKICLEKEIEDEKTKFSNKKDYLDNSIFTSNSFYQTNSEQDLIKKVILKKINRKQTFDDKFYGEDFIGVIVRGIDESNLSSLIFHLKNEDDLYFNPSKIASFKYQKSILIQTNCIENAENICLKLKKIRNNLFQVKANIHHKSSKVRDFTKKSEFSSLFYNKQKDTNEFNSSITKNEGRYLIYRAYS